MLYSACKMGFFKMCIADNLQDAADWINPTTIIINPWTKQQYMLSEIKYENGLIEFEWLFISI